MGHGYSVLDGATASHPVGECVQVATEGTESAGLEANAHPPVVAGVHTSQTLEESSLFFALHFAQSLSKELLSPGGGKEASAEESILDNEAGFSGR